MVALRRKTNRDIMATVFTWLILPGLMAHTGNAGTASSGATQQDSAAVAPGASDVPQLDRLEVHPPRLEFRAPREQAMLLVTGYFSDGTVRDLTREVVLVANDESVVALREGLVQPAANGQTEIVAEMAGRRVLVPVTVSGWEQPHPVSFRTEAVAALTRQGCNSGACHGSPSGKGGFRLSLAAYDHDFDVHSLTRDARGRRTNSIDPAESLLLLKPTMRVHHGGGLQLRTTDYCYDVLHQWIAEGTKVDSDAGRRCLELSLWPHSGRVLKHPHARQQILARAHFDDGTTRDVTRLTKFSSSDDEIANVSEDGLVIGRRRGGVAIMARYLNHLVSCQFTFIQDVDDFQWPDPPAHNFIDELVYEKLQQLQFPPSELCSDHDFVRRIYLDVIGRLPTLAEQDEFIHSPQPDRRARLIDSLLDRPEHAQFWALKWGDLLRLQKDEISEVGVHKLHQWLVDSFRENVPFDQFARELLTSEGSTFDHPAANFFRACDNAELAAETTAQLFLGSRIQCAKCHNHPYEDWTQDNYYGLSAFFNRIGRKPGFRQEEQIVFVSRGGEVRHPRTGQTMKPWLPGDDEVHDVESQDRRAAFAQWLTSPENPFFAKVAVNRLWAEVMGLGIVEPVDDMRQSNPPANGPLLDKLAEDFVQHGYDQRHTLRTILNSRVYQLSSQANELNREDHRYFSHAQMRMLTAEQLLDAVCQVTDVPESFSGLPAGTRATAVPGPDFGHAFLETFGRPSRMTACACERRSDSTLAQAIQLFNGSLIHEKLTNQANRIYRRLEEGNSPRQIVEELYRVAFCRSPTSSELVAALDHIAAQDEPAHGLKDVCWALLNTDEFLAQH